MKEEKIIIVGGGPAGIAASLYLKRANIDVTLIENGPNALARAPKIENYYGAPLPGPELYAQGLQQAHDLGVNIINDEVLSVEYFKEYTVTLKNNPEKLTAPALILATGTKNITVKVPGLAEHEGKGVSYCAVCDGFFFRQKRVAVVGSGAFALHEAEYLKHLASSVTILTNGEDDSLAKAAGFTTNTQKLKTVKGEFKVESVELADGSQEELDGLFVAIGTADSTDIARKLGAQLDGRFIKIDENGATNIPGLFAAGDCTGGLLQVAKASYQGAQAGLAAIKYLRNQ